MAERQPRRIVIDARPRSGTLQEAQLRSVHSLVAALAVRSPEDRYFLLLGEGSAAAFERGPENLEVERLKVEHLNVERLGAVPVRFWFERFGARALARRWRADIWVSLFQAAPRVACPALSATEGGAAERHRLARPGIDLEAFAPTPIDPAARRIILSQPGDEEAAELLIRTYVQLAEQMDAPDLVLIGAHDWPRALWTRPLCPVARQIQVHRTVSPVQLRAHYASAQLVVIPGIGGVAEQSLLAGLASQTPVVSVEHPGLRRIGGDAVAYARADDEESLAKTMAEVLAPTELAAELGVRGRLRAAEFSWDRAAQAFEEVCSSVLQAEPTRARHHPAHGFDRSVARA